MSELETPERTPSPVLYAPAPTTREEPKPAAPRRIKQSAWYAKPPVIGCAGLGLLIVELVTYGLLGPLWWAVSNGVALILVFGAVLAWRRRGKGGFLDRLFSRWGRLGTNHGRSGGARAGGKGNGRWSGLKGRSGGGASGGKGSGRFAGLRSRLPRVLGGTRRHTLNAGQGRTTGGGKPLRLGARLRSKLPRALGGSGRPARGSSVAGSSSRGAGRKFGLSKLRKSRTGGTGATGRKSSRASSGQSKPSFMPVWLRKKKTATKPTSDNRPTPKPTNKTDNSNPSPSASKVDGRRSADPKREQPTQPPALPAPRKPDGPRHAARSNQGGSVNDIQYSDDQSLQRWGANLKGAEEAAAEIARLYAEAESAKERFNSVFGKIKMQGETELPAAPEVMAEVESIHQRATTASSADDWHAIVIDAAGLPTTYAREHETDEDRIHAPRRSLEAEKRADVSHASQDN